MFLKQSTASQEILLGPFVDDTDGKTAETGLTIANTDIKVWKSGGTTESNKNSGGATHIASGRYYAVLDATDTDTVGMLEVNVHVSGALPVRRAFYVLTAAVYDAVYGGSAAAPAGAAELAVVDDFLDTEIAAIKAKTDNLPTDPADASDIAAAFAALTTKVDTIDDFLDTEIAAIKAKTDNLPADPADQSAVEAAILAAWTTALTESYSTDGAAPTPAQALFIIMQTLTEKAISGTTMTVKRLNGSTTAFTLTLDSATTPTSITRAT